MVMARLESLQDWLADLPDLGRAHLQRFGRPLVTLSYAQSLDGCLTDLRGRPFAISGPRSLDITHTLRAAHTAILVGAGTVLADDPQLSVRRVPGNHPQAVILDNRLRTPPEARLFQVGGRPVWIVTSRGAGNQPDRLQAAGAHLLQLLPGPDGRPSLPDILLALAERGIDSVMVEGGASVITAFLQSRLVDWALITVAPVFLGGLGAVEAPLGPRFPRLVSPTWEDCGEDKIVWGRLEYPDPVSF